MPAVPHLLPPTDFAPARTFSYPCLYCDFVAAGASDWAARAAMEGHGRYVNAKLDREADPHFDDVRLDALIGE